MKKYLMFFFIIFTAILQSQTIIIDDFEDGPGRFNLHTTFSGSTRGILQSLPFVDETIVPVSGTKSLKIQLIDNPADSVDWFVRFLSGGGSPASNLVLNDTGFVGFWLRANRDYLSVRIILDDKNDSTNLVGTNEISVPLTVTGGLGWYLYQWDMADTNNWNAFIASGNGKILDPVSIDAIVFSASNSLANNDTVTVWLDKVSFNTSQPLPVELVSFAGTAVLNNVSLKWATATELNNRGFEIERRFENGVWQTVGFVRGNGTTQDYSEYGFTDVVENAGKYQYRLKQSDFSGVFEYSGTIEVDVIGVGGTYTLVQNYPNPFNPETKINYYLPEKGLVNLSVFNMLGEKVAEIISAFQDAGEYSVNFDGRNLNSGVYVYSLQVNGNILNKKMTLLK